MKKPMSYRKMVRRRRRKVATLIFEIFILAILILGLYAYHKLDLIDHEALDESKIEMNEITSETLATFEGYTTIAMFGLDNRDAGELKRGNSDTIIVMNINNDTKEVSMISVYRDTFLNVAAAGEEPVFKKCNSAFAMGGAEQAITMLNRNLDLEIDNYVTFDFTAVADVIDILGGVEVEITSPEELEYLNMYLSDVNYILGRGDAEVTSVGTHNMTGAQAVAYARIRYTAGGDYRRAERQRYVFSQMVKKAKHANVSQLNEIVNTIFPEIRTDLERNQMISMVTAMISYDMTNSAGFPFDRTTTELKKKGDVVVPCDLQSNVIQLHNILFDTESYQPSSAIQQYNEAIISETGKTAADAVADDFSEVGTLDSAANATE